MQTMRKARLFSDGQCWGIAMFAVLSFPLSAAAFAQSEDVRVANNPATVVPQQMKYAGTAANRAGDTVEAVFRIYATPEGGEPLWTETQRIAVDPNGKYSVLLGAATQGGLPQRLFAAGQARWLGVSIERGEEISRSPLVSVAYAMKAGDAETIDGMSARRFVTQEQLAAAAKTLAAQLASTVLPQVTNPTGTGTAGYLAMWTGSNTLGNALLYQAGNKIGIGTLTPSTALHVHSGDLTIGGQTLNFPTAPVGAAAINQIGPISLLRQAVGDFSGRFNIYWNAYNDSASNKYYASSEPATKWNIGGVGGAGGTGVYVAPAGTAGAAVNWNTVYSSDNLGNVSLANKAMYLNAGGNVGINTTTPTAKLEVNGTAKFDGLVTFAGSQTFPGTGTITGITTTGPLTGSGTSGSVALGLNTAALETTLDSRYATLAGNNEFTGAYGLFDGYVEAHYSAGSSWSAVVGYGTNGSGGIYGSSDSGSGVHGMSTSSTGVSGFAFSPAPFTAGVLGVSGGNSANYSAEANIANAGVWSDTASNGKGVPVSLFATGDDAYGLAVVTRSANFPAIYADNPGGEGAVIDAGSGDALDATTASQGSGVVGQTSAPVTQQAGVRGIAGYNSNVYGQVLLFSGVWGDTGADTSQIIPTWAVGVIGTADNSRAGVFLNNSASYPAVYMHNYDAGGAIGFAKTLMASTGDGVCGIGDGGSLSCTGQIKALVPAGSSGHTVETYAMQSPENWMEDFGSGELVKGVAVVHIDPAFAETIAGDGGYHVFLTANADSKGLYVIAKTATTFEVRESGGGTSSLAFDYRIVGKRRGFESQRLKDVTQAMAAATQAQLVKSSTPIQPQVKKHPALALAALNAPRAAADRGLPAARKSAPRQSAPLK